MVLFGSIFWAVVIISILIIAFIVSEVKENGYIAFSFSIACALAFYFWGQEAWDKITSVVTLGMVFLYLGIGLIHSFFRTFIFARKKIKKAKQKYFQYHGRTKEPFPVKEQSDSLKNDLQGNVFRWWLMWPISLLVWIFSDFIKDLYDWVYGKLKAMYEGIFDLGVKSALKDDSKSNSQKNETIETTD